LKNKKVSVYFIVSFVIFMVGFSIYKFFIPMFGDDYWWHIKAGEYMLSNRAIPYIDVFSWYSKDNHLYWYSHEWLTEVIFAGINKLFGEGGVYLFIIGLGMLIPFLTIKFNWKELKENKLIAIVWGVIGVQLLSMVATPRPHMISFTLLVFVVYALSKFLKNEESKWIWSIPVISMLWANLHGGSSNLPYVLTLLTLVLNSFNFTFYKVEFKKISNKGLFKLLLVAVLSILAILINPHGVDMVIYPYDNMQDSFMLSFISEWRSPDLKLATDFYIYALIFVIGMIFLLTDKKIKGFNLLMTLAFVYLTFKSIRFGVLLYIVSSFTVFEYVTTLTLKEKHIKYLSALLVVIGLAMPQNLLFTNYIMKNPITEPITEEMIEAVKTLNAEHLYNDYDLGGYLIYHDIEVFVDSRADLYTKHNLKDAINLMSLRRVDASKLSDIFDVEAILNKYEFDAFIIKNSRPLYSYLSTNDKYELVLEDHNISLFKVKQ